MTPTVLPTEPTLSPTISPTSFPHNSIDTTTIAIAATIPSVVCCLAVIGLLVYVWRLRSTRHSTDSMYVFTENHALSVLSSNRGKETSILPEAVATLVQEAFIANTVAIPSAPMLHETHGNDIDHLN